MSGGGANARLCGIWGHPYLDLEPFLPVDRLDELDDEITLGLTRAEVSYTGGTLKWMGVVAPWVQDDGHRDAMHAIHDMDDEELRRFVRLGDQPQQVARDLESLGQGGRAALVFGDETPRPFSRQQMLFLEYRHQVYFPWKVCYHLLANDRWEDKHSGEGKEFGDEACELFPRTVELLQQLPFREIGRAVIFGLRPHDHAPMHRDTEPGAALAVAQSISLDPRGSKRFTLCDAEGGNRTPVASRAYWFNDMDYHGVEADPCFRYSIRVDGMFERDFAEALRRRYG